MLNNRSNTARLRLQLDHDAAQRKTQILRDRGEELYVLVEQWLNGLTGYYLGRSSVMLGKLDYNQCLNAEMADMKDYPVNFTRIELLIAVYFPSARLAYQQISKDRDTLNKIATEHKRSYAAGDIDGTRFFKPFQQAMLSINETDPILKQSLLESIRAL